jgi:hypothetical protein
MVYWSMLKFSLAAQRREQKYKSNFHSFAKRKLGMVGHQCIVLQISISICRAGVSTYCNRGSNEDNRAKARDKSSPDIFDAKLSRVERRDIYPHIRPQRCFIMSHTSLQFHFRSLLFRLNRYPAIARGRIRLADTSLRH